MSATRRQRGHRADAQVGVSGQVPQRGAENLIRARRTDLALAPVAGQRVERGDPDPGVGIIGHGDELVHGLGVDQVVQQTAATLTNSRIAVLEAPDKGLAVGPDESEHDLSLQ